MMAAIEAAVLKRERERAERVQAAAPEMVRCLQAMTADHTESECWGQGPCWPHRILHDIDTPPANAAPDLNDPDGGRRSD